MESTLVWIARGSRQLDMPALPAKMVLVPPGQVAQPVARKAYVPTAQIWHAVDPAALTRPSAQLWHPDLLAAVRYVPAGQAVQWPVAGLL